MEKLNGRDIGANNLIRFESWVVERDAARDWSDYVRGDKLNQTDVAVECGVALSVLRQNPAVKQALAALEVRLLAAGLFERSTTTQDSFNGPVAEASRLAVHGRILVAVRATPILTSLPRNG